MTVTLAQIHEDPAILDRAIASQETLEILSCGEVAATLMPRRVSAMEKARREMAQSLPHRTGVLQLEIPSHARSVMPAADCLIKTKSIETPSHQR